MFVEGSQKQLFFPSDTLIYAICRDGSKNYNILACEHMILVQLRMGARHTIYAPLSHSESGCCQQGINAKKGNTSSFSVPVLSYFIFFQWPRRGLFSPKIRTSQNANLTKKECSNQKV